MSRIVIDANLNRAREGLRVLEDAARFILRNEKLSLVCKQLRHGLQIQQPCRDVEKDAGVDVSVNAKSNLLEIINANAARAQEALRVLTEFSKNPNYFENLRFSCYQLHQKIFVEAQQFLQTEKLNGLYLICDLDLYPVPLSKIAEAVLDMHVSIVQFRKKDGSNKEKCRLVKELRRVLSSETLLIVNDHLDIGLAFADGVHLGQADFPVAEARKIAGPSFIIGASVNSVAEVKELQAEGATYLGAGCLFSSKTKMDTRPLPFKTLRKIIQTARIPVCAIGGINHDNVSLVMKESPAMIAVCRAIWRPLD